MKTSTMIKSLLGPDDFNSFKTESIDTCYSMKFFIRIFVKVLPNGYSIQYRTIGRNRVCIFFHVKTFPCFIQQRKLISFDVQQWTSTCDLHPNPINWMSNVQAIVGCAILLILFLEIQSWVEFGLNLDASLSILFFNNE